MALSATINDERIHAALGPDVAIWSLTAENAHNDILRRAEDQSAFKVQLRQLLNRIKTVHGEEAIINVFPALPNSAAVEVRRVWMPKADLPMVIYDQNRSAGVLNQDDRDPALTLNGGMRRVDRSDQALRQVCFKRKYLGRW